MRFFGRKTNKRIVSYTIVGLMLLQSISNLTYALSASVSYDPPSGPTSGNVVATMTGDYDTINNGGTYDFTSNGSFLFEYSSGVETGSLLATVNWIDITAPTVNLTSNISGYTNTGFTITADFSEEVSGFNTGNITPGNLTISNFNTISGSQYTFDVLPSSEGIVTIDIDTTPTDLAGNPLIAPAQFSITYDITKPTASIEYSPGSGSLTNTDVLATITGFNELTITGLNSADFTFTGNGSYLFTFSDLAGNTGETNSSVTWIDKTIPTAQVEFNITGNTNQDVIVTITGFSETITGLNSTGFIFTGNGSYVFDFSDLAGNTGTVTGDVTRIDKSAVTGTVSYDITGWTNTNVVATIAYNKTGVSGVTGYTFTGNGSYIFTFTDAYGNTGEETATVNNIDLEIPSFAGVLSGTTYWTGVTITFDDDVSATATINGSGYTSGDLINNEGINILVVTDPAGNSTGATFRIDTTTPIITINGSGDITLEVFSNYVESGAIRDDNGLTGSANISGSVNTGALGSYTLTYRYSDGNHIGTGERIIHIVDTTLPIITLNGSGTLTLERLSSYVESGASRYDNVDGTGTVAGIDITGTVDNSNTGVYDISYIYVDGAGNTGSTIRTVTVIDTTPPTASLVYDITGVTNQDVNVIITGFSETITGINATGYTFTGNGSFVFNFEDIYGNASVLTASVNYIDKSAVTGTISYDITGATNNDVIASIVYNKTGVSGVTGYTFTGNGSYIFTFTDAYGNTGEETATVNRIDKSPVTGTVSYDITGATNQNVIATVTGFNKTGVIVSGSSDHTFTNTGSYTFYFTDTAGNTGSATATVTWIDKTNPTASASFNITGLTNQDVIVTLTGFSETLTGISSSDFTFTGNGSYVFDFSDLAGNTGTVTGDVTRIDKSAVTGTVSYDITGATNNDVVASISYNKTGVSGITGYTFTGNGSYIFTFTDAYGNTGEETATVNRIDKSPVNGTVSYDITGATNNDVIASITGFNKTGVTITSSGSYTFTGNGDYIFTFTDAYGNTGEETATVNRIDKIDPIITSTGSSITTTGSATFTGIQVTESGAGIDTIILNYSGTINSSITGSIYLSTGNLTDVGGTVLGLDDDQTYIYTITATDLVGNTTTITGGTFTTLFDYQEEYALVVAALSGTNISGNLNEVTNDNVNYFTGLYFEQSAGKIEFLSGVDLHDTDTITFLQNLDNYLFMSGGYIRFFVDSGSILSGSELNVRARLTMYLTPNRLPTGVGLDTSLIIVKDNNGNIITPSSSVISDLNCAGSAPQTCTFITEHFTEFGIAPTLTDVNITSDNSSGSRALSGDIIILSFTGSENLTGVSITIWGTNVTAVGAGTFWSGTYTTDGTETGGLIPFTINFEDLWGFTGATVSSTTDSSSVTFDNILPTITINNPDSLPAQSKTITATGSDTNLSGFYLAISTGTDCNGTLTFSTYTSITFTGESDNGKYVCYKMEDIAGNTTYSGSVMITGIDITKPTATIDYNPTSGAFTSGNVETILTGYSESLTGINQTGYTFTDNGTSLFTFSDLAGNTGSVTADVNWIDKTYPTFAGVSTGTYYSGNVIITFDDTNISGATLNGADYASGTLITADNNYVFLVTDLAGNSTGVSFIVDKTQPSFAGVSSGTYYSGNVTIILSDTNLSGATLNGTAFTSGSTVSTDGVYTLLITDLAGNSTGATFTIDKTQPIFAGASTGVYYSGSKSITFSDTNLSGATLNGAAFTSGDTVSAEGVYTLLITDLAGNSTGATFIIDKTQPSWAGASSGYYYSGNITITFSDTYLSGATMDGSGFTSGSTVSSEGIHTLLVTDLAGNSTGATFIIDKTQPSWAGASSGYYYSGNITLTFGDTNISGATLNGADYASGTLITADNNYVFLVTDLAGNSTGVSFVIDNTQPSFAGASSGSYYSGDVEITFSDTNLSGATLNGSVYSYGELITGENTYIFIATDLAGNSTGITFFIDKTGPTITGGSLTNLTSQTPTFSFTVNDTGTISRSGSCGSATSAISSGANSITLSSLGNATYSGCYVLPSDTLGNTGSRYNIPEFTVSYTAPSGGGGGGGAGGGSVGPATDYCPDGDNSSSKYDGTCIGETTPVIPTWAISGSIEITYTGADTEEELAILMLYENGLTKYNTIIGFQGQNMINREQAAKFLAQFAINVMGKTPDTTKIAKFSDLNQADPTLKDQIILSYQLGIFGGYPDGTFNNKKNMTKGEAAAVLLRIYLGKKLYEGISPWYQNYVTKLKELGVISSTLGDFNQSISREDLALWIYRISLLKGYTKPISQPVNIDQPTDTGAETEKENAILMLYENGLTKYNTMALFQGQNMITREQASKFLAQFAISVMNKIPDTTKVAKFSDLDQADPTLKDQIILAYQLGVFGGYPDGTFKTTNLMTKGEAAAVLLRIYLGKKLFEGINPWYQNYIVTLNELGVISSTASDFNTTISREDLALWIYRISLLK